MNIAVIRTSRKENEKRVPIHPEHIKNMPEDIRQHLFFEKGYGIPFGISDEQITALTGNELLDRKVLFDNFKAIIITKPVEKDFSEMQNGTVVWGWVHSVQQNNIAQIAINKKLTLFAWESMYHVSSQSKTHIFQKNNELAGYCGVQHALQLRGIDGNFGPARKVVVISFGSVSRGAISALKGRGLNDITVLTRRPSHLVSDKISGVEYKRFYKNKTGRFDVENQSGETNSLITELISADIIVNGIMQNPNNPITFINDNDVSRFKKECIIVDVSCDLGMGFSFARPTNFTNPLYKQGKILYYAVDHTPTLLWDSASWEISTGLLPYLNDFIHQNHNVVLDDATDIKNGVIINSDILVFQNRSPIYPHEQIENKSKEKVC